MSEYALSIKLRIRLIERFSDVDLPSFMFDHLDQLLAEVTYFKLINLEENMTGYLLYLQDLAEDYYTQVQELSVEQMTKPYATHIYAPYFTDKLYAEQWKPTCGLQDLLRLKQRFLVVSTLTSKEYMYKKQKSSLLAPLSSEPVRTSASCV